MRSIEQAYSDAKRFVEDIVRACSTSTPGSGVGFGNMGYTYSSVDKGGFALDPEESKRHRRLLEDLHEAVEYRIGKGSLVRRLNEFILDSVDPRGLQKERPADERVRSAATAFRDTIKRKPRTFVALLPIAGLKPPSKPIELGNIRITSLASQDVQDLLSRHDAIVDTTTNAIADKAFIKQSLRHDLEVRYADYALAAVDTLAIDGEAAAELAGPTLNRKLDAINFLLDITKGSDGHHALVSAEKTSMNHFYFAIDPMADGSCYGTHHLRKVAFQMDVDDLVQTMDAPGLVSTLWALLQKREVNGHEERALTATQWAGRALTASRPEDAFLFRIIALESLLVADKGESVFKISHHAAHLLGGWIADRKRIVDDIKHLYTIRSAIVHLGSYEVSPPDHKLVRAYIAMSLQRVLVDEPFKLMHESKDLTQWFASRLRGDG